MGILRTIKMKKDKKKLLAVLIFLLFLMFAVIVFFAYQFLFATNSKSDFQGGNMEGTDAILDEKQYIECETAAKLHTFYEDEGFITNECGDYGLIQNIEWEDKHSGHGIDWQGNEVEFWY